MRSEPDRVQQGDVWQGGPTGHGDEMLAHPHPDRGGAAQWIFGALRGFHLADLADGRTG